MKGLGLFPFLVCILSLICHSSTCLEVQDEDFYKHTVINIKGEKMSLETYRGKVSLVVNVASECGFTDSHYKSLKRLHDILSFNAKFNVLAFPCNQFGEQEPLDNEHIEQFAVQQYGVEFPMFSKIDVIGENASPAIKNLIAQSSVQPEWNFYKYLVDHNGRVLKAWSTKVPIEEIFADVKAAVDKAESLPALKTDNEASSSKDEL